MTMSYYFHYIFWMLQKLSFLVAAFVFECYFSQVMLRET